MWVCHRSEPADSPKLKRAADSQRMAIGEDPCMHAFNDRARQVAEVDFRFYQIATIAASA